MGWGFRKSFKVAPGVRINVGKKGVSTSMGVKGFTVNSRGRVTTSIPGTGVRYTTSLTQKNTLSGQSAISMEAPAMAQGKRAVDNENFAHNLLERRQAAISAYLLSHGILAGPQDLGQALSIDNHAEFFNGLEEEFTVTKEALKLLQDIGSLSLQAKEKAMKALYAIEEKLSAAHGNIAGITEGLVALDNANRSIPQKPRQWAYIFLVLILALLSFSVPPLWLVTLGVAGVGLYKRSRYQKQMTRTTDAISKANATLEGLIEHEVTPRTEFVA